jgi:glucose-1-phosphate cytidylyltransferase
MIQTFILCGGKGTRIRGVDDDVPKPMVKIGDQPILWHIMKTYAKYGFNEFVLLLGHKSEVVKEYFLNFRALTSDISLTLGKPDSLEYLSGHEEEDWKVTLANTGREAMTGARIFRASKYLKNSTFFATYGDGVSNINIKKLLEFHKRHGCLATVTGVHPQGRFGGLVVEGDKVTSFNEKPLETENLINGGFFVFEREFVEKYLSDDESLTLERKPLEQVANDGQLKVFRHDGFWQPMDTFREWKLLNELWGSGAAPWRVTP